DTATLSQIDSWLGEYISKNLGRMKFTKTQDLYEMEFEDWKSQVGYEIDKNGKMSLVLTSPPLSGLITIQMQGSRFVINYEQEQYEFIRKYNDQRGARMGKIITQCPSCETEQLYVSKIQCRNCQTIFEGKFEIP